VANNGSVGIVVATRDRKDRLLDTLALLTSLPERPSVLVVDNASTDGTVEAVKERFPTVGVVALTTNVGAAARNVGVQSIGTEIVALCDDDSWWAPGALERAAETMSLFPKVGLIAGRILVGEEERLDPTCAVMARGPSRPELPGPAVTGFVACGCVVRRVAFLGAGGFHQRYGVGAEERLLAIDLMTAGWDLAYVDDVVAHHHPSREASNHRQVQSIRNDLWTAWLRLGPVDALLETMRMLSPGNGATHRVRGLVHALGGLPWIASERAPVSRDVRDRYRQVAQMSKRPGSG
jgi:GT2 family glycosyltransferase